jgi:hypothetical protein
MERIGIGRCKGSIIMAFAGFNDCCTKEDVYGF